MRRLTLPSQELLSLAEEVLAHARRKGSVGTELPLLTSAVARARGRVLASVYSLIPGMAEVIRVN